MSFLFPFLIHLVVSYAFSVFYLKVVHRKPFSSNSTVLAALGDMELVKLILIVNLLSYAVALVFIRLLLHVEYDALRHSIGSSIHTMASIVIYIQAQRFDKKHI